jgi:geranylgeranyl diphosphate synthase, type III
MVGGNSYPNPNAIPPRTSSSGFVTNGTSQPSPSKPVLKPIAEVDWLGQSKKSPTSPHHPSPTYAHRRGVSLPASMTARGSEPPPDFAHEQIYRKRAGWSAEKERIVQGPFEYLLGHPGKDIRSQLIAAFNAWLKVPDDSLDVIKKVVGMLHTASLL